MQGVGFRAFTHRLASSLGLSGDVRNADGHVVVRAAGPVPALRELARRLAHDAPPGARVGSVVVAELPDHVLWERGFRVVDSTASTASTASAAGTPGVEGAAVPRGSREVPPDLATCEDCLVELFDRNDRRYRYPFLNCAVCGPRASIIEALPYDRARTTMRHFPMCQECAEEYHDPTSRRCRAEPVACPSCGPQLTWTARDARSPSHLAGAALGAAERVVAEGGVVAVKGVGGYQLVCDATDETAVRRLRRIKGQPHRPFPVMVRDLAAARSLAALDGPSAALLHSPARPVVLLPGRVPGRVGDSVAPGMAELGVQLPHSPTHHLLLADLDRPLVVTSGNRAGDPMIIEDEHARTVLGPVVDGVLAHDRVIRSRYEDSVRRVVAGRVTTLRRGRGNAPLSLRLPVRVPSPVLAVGARLAHTAALAQGDHVVLTPPGGDLSNPACVAAFQDTIATFLRLHAIEPEVVAHDLCPEYVSTRYAGEFAARRRIGVQHHHAHVVATAAEHRVNGPFLGVVYDGTGLGEDGTLWGGEILLADYARYRRLARFGTAPLPGGEAAAHRPAWSALGYLFGAERLGNHISPSIAPDLLERRPAEEVAGVRSMIASGVNCPRSSSAARLFDAVACLLGLCDEVGYDGEAVLRLEAAAGARDEPPALGWRLARQDELWVYDPVPTLWDVLVAATDCPLDLVAARFHTTVAEVTTALVTRCAEATGVRTVCLGGAVFQNRRLTASVLGRLTREGLEVLVGERVPAHDGGISYGQAVVAAARLAQGG
ncbi:hydrogenase maturation protein HypF [Streptoalloteichus tenebrarius]|uniref:Carbamoyltransferase n=1 Tax=Streptoalloteichus tenebrarius (strain ATCC 17920 / DSM 40477 / JCM 4838 / CBS 697.72 / NBRC 16177 / NCIMB 11028 / NRRL B-12390 / A12253. 1 / ISP 5477) TaxID=1933 RepID=A0ABT1HUB5_STRSD|nr:hydrogenase maturation protein HypF [Streptoalloteichus tenebrarius]BFE99565.1 carbamoyltransferase HypF [Streptoalloteichus tenebrarius]